MHKIPTVFMRDPRTRKVIPEFHPACLWVRDGEGVPTEKLDGTNVRLTTRRDAGGLASVVRVEKRRNPSREQKARGLLDPWYVDASQIDPSDQHIVMAVQLTECALWEDGEHVCEALGPNINGNPLGLDYPRCVKLFGDYNGVPLVNEPMRIHSMGAGIRGVKVERIARTFEGMRTLVMDLESQYSKAMGTLAEGIVFRHPDGMLAKIKRKDFE